MKQKEKTYFKQMVQKNLYSSDLFNNNDNVKGSNVGYSNTLPNKKKSELEGIMKDMIEKENEWWAKVEPKKEDNKICNSDENKE